MHGLPTSIYCDFYSKLMMTYKIISVEHPTVAQISCEGRIAAKKIGAECSY